MTLLKLDLDGPIPRGFLYRVRHKMSVWRWTVQGMRFDKTRHGWHVTIQVRQTLKPLVVVCAQAALGSDLNRETFNMMRVMKVPEANYGWWARRWNVLYKNHSRGVKLSA